MTKAAADWTEDDVLQLPSGENDTFERKGAMKLDLTIGAKENDVLDELAKQLSAFANTGAGQIIYGVKDDGTIDNGGITRQLKGRQSAKDWLESVIPVVVEPEIVRCNVYEIPPKAASSAIAQDKSLYVVDVPDSERAPHQSTKDFRYYVRLGAKSLPARHRMIEDIRSRQRHPTVKVASVELAVDSIQVSDGRDGPTLNGEAILRFTATLHNSGRIMARNVGVQIDLPTSILRMHDTVTMRLRGLAEKFLELNGPLYPGMSIAFWMQFGIGATFPPVSPDSPVGGPWLVAGKTLDDCRIAFGVFADNAPINQSEFTLAQLKFRAEARLAVKRVPDGVALLMAHPAL